MSQSLLRVLYITLVLNCNYFVINGQFSNKKNNDNVGNEVNLWLNAAILMILIILFVYSVRFSPKCRRRRRKLPHEIRLEKTNKQINAQLKDLNKSLSKSSSFIRKLYNKSNQDDQYINIDEDEYDEMIDNNYNEYNDLFVPDNITDSTDNVHYYDEEEKYNDHDDDVDDDDDSSIDTTDFMSDDFEEKHKTKKMMRQQQQQQQLTQCNNNDRNNRNNDKNEMGMIKHGKLLINNINHYIQMQYDEYKENHSNFMQDMLGMDSYNNPQNQQYRHLNNNQYDDNNEYEQL